MTLAIVIIAAITIVIVAALIAAAITSTRPPTPCLFDKTVVLFGERRYGDSYCSGKVDNIYFGVGSAKQLDDRRVCDGHVKDLMDLADALENQAAAERLRLKGIS